MKPEFNRAVLIASLLLALRGGASAQGMELRAVMQDMGRDLQVVVDAISREDWTKVADAAGRIVSHAQPSDGEKTRIITFFGPDMGHFKSFDSQTGEAARQIEQAAREGKPQEVIDSVARLQTSCLGCHQAFRERFVVRFYQPDRVTRRD